MTRRAKHWHSGIIEKFVTPARVAAAAGFFHVHSRSDGGRALRPRLVETRSWSADRRAAVRTIAGRARANVPARGAESVARAAAVSGITEIGFAPETIAPRRAICRVFAFFVGETMTAYLISLALAGLVAIVLWEMFA
ncbi:hypothetical protein [Bradyrhizobium betae]|uniref:Uncharacterized protein n=1 Tax=Bradyrhizobium betae TaxID=244734 RepID=A0A5P6PDB3_9BRAD|nr:hypothetical protein [Bradyrhizobium betae]MCS3726502.1 hypothetical protein [Bradyrhizobium betae]QFI75503.1 hypothetical protein F8237_25775 [Bradyrhizobium betae]